MLRISGETYKKLYEEYRSATTLYFVVSVISGVLGILLFLFLPFGWKFITLLFFAFPFALSMYMRKKLLPEGNGKSVRDIIPFLKRDLFSGNMENLIKSKIRQAGSFPDKVTLICALSDVYLRRNEMTEAVNTLNSIDRSQFMRYPDSAVLFFSKVIYIYFISGDYASVEHAYADAEEYIDAALKKGFLFAKNGIAALIYAFLAAGKPYDALELALADNDISVKETERSKVLKGSALSKESIGASYLTVAQCYYKCGGMSESARYCDIAGPLIDFVPHRLKVANDLSQKIRENKND